MSYILDALKKSESERGHGAIPGVQTVHSSSINYHQQKKAIWPYFLIAAVLLNIMFIAYFIYTQNSPTQSAFVPVEQSHSTLTDSTKPLAHTVLAKPVAEKIEETPVSSTLAKSTPKVPTSSATQTKEVMPTSPIASRQTLEKNSPQTSTFTAEKIIGKSISSAEISAHSVEPTNEIIVERHELPEHIQRELPTLTISAHVYSSNPAQRSIIVNNAFFEEKDYIMDDIALHEITRDGAIFSYNGLLFHNRSVSGWQ